LIYSGFGDCKPCSDGEEGGGGECQVFLRHLRLPQRQENGCVVLLRQTVGREIMMNLRISSLFSFSSICLFVKIVSDGLTMCVMREPD